MVRRRGLAAAQAFARGSNVSRCFDSQSSESAMGTQWRVCLCHDAFPRAISCHFLQAQALDAELDFAHRIGFRLAGLHFTGCLRFQFHPVQHAAEYPASPLTHAMPAQSARPCTFPARPNPPTLVQRFTLCGQIVLRPCLLVMNQRTLMQAEDVMLQGGKGNRVRILNCPLASG